MREKYSWLDEPVFILSIGKTGTTLLISLFDGHDELVVIPEETDFFCAVYTPLSMICANPLLSKKKKIDKIFDLMVHGTHLHVLNKGKREKSFAKDNYDYTDFDFETFETEVKTYLSETNLELNSILKSVPYAFAKSNKIDTNKLKLWIEKTPYHLHNVDNKVPELEKAFPKAKFIHIFRDPVDNYIAYKKKDNAKWSLNKFVYDFKRNVRITKEHLDKENHYLIKYEDIVLSTQSTLESLTSFLGISNKKSLIKPTKHGIPWEGNSVETSQFKGISATSLDKHLKYKKKDELKYIEFYLQDELAFLNYSTKYLKEEDSFSGYEGYPAERRKEDALTRVKTGVHQLFTKAIY